VATAIGLISATFGIGGGAGLVLSGLIVDNLAYEWIFWLALVVVIFAMVMTRLFVPESPVKSPARIDWTGAALLSGGLIALLAAVSEGNRWGWDSPAILGLFALAAVLLGWLVRYELGFGEPLVDMRMMRARPVLATNITGLLIGFGMFGSFILIPQLVQTPESTGFGFGASVTEAGLFMLPSTAMMLIAGPIAGALGTRWGSKLPLLIGSLVTAAALLFLAVAHEHRLAIYVASAMTGLGIGFSFASMANLVVESVDQRQTGIASGMNTIMRTIGGSIGGQIAASVVAGHVAGGFPTSTGFTIAFSISAVAVLGAFLCALAIPSRRRVAADVVPLPAARDAGEPEMRRAGAA
jgi:MFS family permease